MEVLSKTLEQQDLMSFRIGKHTCVLGNGIFQFCRATSTYAWDRSGPRPVHLFTWLFFCILYNILYNKVVKSERVSRSVVSDSLQPHGL